MVERFNGRIVSEVLAITVYSHDQLEQLLRGFNAAYNARRQRVLEGQTPDQVVAARLTAKPALAKAKPSGRAGPDDIIKARLIAESAKEVSQPDTGRLCTLLDAFKTLPERKPELLPDSGHGARQLCDQLRVVRWRRRDPQPLRAARDRWIIDRLDIDAVSFKQQVARPLAQLRLSDHDRHDMRL